MATIYMGCDLDSRESTVKNSNCFVTPRSGIVNGPMTPPATPTGDGLQEITRASADMIERLLRELPVPGNADMAALLRVFASADGLQLAKLRSLEEAFYRDHLSWWTHLNAP